MKQCHVCRRTYPDATIRCDDDGTTLQALSEVAPGTIIRGKYKVLSLIGAGGMATVYRALHIAFNEECAIKVVNDRYSGDRTLSQRFRTEAIITRKLRHPNAVVLEDLDELEDGRPFMVMELVVGKSLRDVIRFESPMPPLRAISIVRQVASALAAAHMAGIAHRDIKPENIILVNQPEGEIVKVLDFGVAKVRNELYGMETTHATGPGMIIGTPAYMAPEQADPKTDVPVDGRADLYSLGIVFYEMLSGVLPFDSDTPMGMLFHQVKTTPRPLTSVLPGMSTYPELTSLIAKCLHKNPYYRHPTIHDFLEGLTVAETAVLEDRAVKTDSANFETLEFHSPAEHRHSDPKLEIAHLLVLECLETSQASTLDRQAIALQELQLIVSTWPEYSRMAEDDLFTLSAAHSIILGFLGNPEAAIRCALYVGSSLRFHPELSVRIGVHSGPVYRARDLMDNISGGGINFAQRVTEWGDQGHILASGTIADLLTQHSVWAACFHEMGVAEVIHGVKLRMFNVFTPDAGNSAIPVKLRSGARRIAAGATGSSASVDVLTPPPMRESRSSDITPSQELSSDHISKVVRELAFYIGPIARVIVKRASQHCSTLDELYATVAREIQSAYDREKFLHSRKKD